MPFNTSMYDKLGAAEYYSPLDSERKAMTLKQLGMQNQAAEATLSADAKSRKVKALGETLEKIAGLPEDQQESVYNQEQDRLLQAGVIDQKEAMPFDRGSLASAFKSWRDSREYQDVLKPRLENRKTEAEIGALKAKARPDADPVSRWMSQQDYKEKKAKQKSEEEMKRYSNVGGWKLSDGATPTPDDAKKFKNGAAAARSLLGSLNEYQSLVQKYGAEVGGPVAQKMDSLARDIQLSAKNEDLYGLGVLTGPDLALLEEIIQAPTGKIDAINPWAGGKANNKAQQFREMMNMRINSKAKTYGFEPDAEWRQLAAGNPKPKGSGHGLADQTSLAGDESPNRSYQDMHDDELDEQLKARGLIP